MPNTNNKILGDVLYNSAIPPAGIQAGKMVCAIYQFGPNMIYPSHSHPKGEYNFVLAGPYTIKAQPILVDGVTKYKELIYQAGDFSYMSPDSIHQETLIGAKGTTILTITPEPIIILPPKKKVSLRLRSSPDVPIRTVSLSYNNQSLIKLR